MTPKIRDSRLANRERHRPTARISRRKSLSLPKRDRIPMQVCEPRFIEQVRANDRSVISLSRPGASRILASDAWRTGAAHGVLRIVIEKAIDVHAKHQDLVRREFVIQPSVEEELPIMTRVIQVSIRRQDKRRK